MLLRLGLAVTLCIASSQWAATAATAQDGADDPDTQSKELSIGSVAPKLDIEHWVHDGKGKLGPVEQFQEGKIYVVEFWATWCGPCIASMPHISELQQTHEKDGVTIISVSDEQLDKVAEFLRREVDGDEGMTYFDLTQHYCLTTDPDRSVYEDYMVAAGQNGIPTAFIVGKTGHIEWIGHPMTMDEPLNLIIDDRWDRDAFEDELRVMEELQEALPSIIVLIQEGKGDEARARMDEFQARVVSSSMKEQLKSIRFSMEYNMIQFAMLQGNADVVKHLNSAIETFSDDAQILRELAWIVISVVETGESVSDELTQAARAAADRAVELSPENSSMLSTLAWIAHAQGDVDLAIEAQTKAVEFASDEEREEMERVLRELRDRRRG